jgi:hypothetical protein
MLAPALSIILAYSIVLLTSLNIRNLAVTGIERFLCRMLTTHTRKTGYQQENLCRTRKREGNMEGALTHSFCISYPNHPARNSHNSLSLRYPADSRCDRHHHHHHRNRITEFRSAPDSSSHLPAFERTRGVRGRTHKLISTASQCFSTSFAACKSTSGSLAANYSRAYHDEDDRK